MKLLATPARVLHPSAPTTERRPRPPIIVGCVMFLVVSYPCCLRFELLAHRTRVVLTFPGGTFDSSATSSWEKVVRVVIGFSAADGTASSASNSVTINHLVVGHALDL